MKRGQAGVLTIILMVLIAIVVFIIIFNVISIFLKKSTDEINIQKFRLNGDIDYWLDEVAVVQVHRGAGTGNITGVKIVFSTEDGSTYVYTTFEYPEELDTKVYVILKNDDKLDKTPLPITEIREISLHYIYETGKITDELDSEMINPNQDNRISPKLSESWYLDSDGDYYGAGSVYESQEDCENNNPGENCVPFTGDCQEDDDPSVILCASQPEDCSGDWLTECGICIHPTAEEICDGIDNDCDTKTDENNGNCEELDPTKPYCNEGVCSGIKNYLVTPSAINSQWVDCTSNIKSSDFDFSFVNDADWVGGIPFYNEELDSVRVCKNGYILVEGSCSRTVGDISTIQGLSPYWTNIPAFGAPVYNIHYCTSSDRVVFRWSESGTGSKDFQAEAIIYKSGEIRYSYQKGASVPRKSEVGIAYSGANYNEIRDNSESGDYSDYRLTF